MSEKKPTNPWTKSLFIWMAILVGLVLFVQMFDGKKEASGDAMTYSEFVGAVNEGNVKSVTITRAPGGDANIAGKLASDKTFTTIAPGDAQVSKMLIDKGVAVQVKAQEGGSIWLLLLSR